MQVRPFTLGQLKELLGRTGTVLDDGFWIDKIKSHCYVTVRTHTHTHMFPSGSGFLLLDSVMTDCLSLLPLCCSTPAQRRRWPREQPSTG